MDTLITNRSFKFFGDVFDYVYLYWKNTQILLISLGEALTSFTYVNYDNVAFAVVSFLIMKRKTV